MNFTILCKALELSNQSLVAAIKSLGRLEQIFTQHPDDLYRWFNQRDVSRIRHWHKSGKILELCSVIEKALAAEDSTVLSFADKNYPAILAEIPDPPAILFIKGEVSSLGVPQIALVGSRNCTAQGRRIAQDFAAELSSAGFCITSGLALGIDAAAHQGALQRKGKTLAVMGTGLDVIYPARNQSLAREILARDGALVSEFIPGSPPLAWHFPNRNRIVTGLSLGVVVIEAGERSGSLISARLAAEQGREVFAIPGSPISPVSAGCNRLVREGATLVTEPWQVVEQLGPMLDFQIQAQQSVVISENALVSASAEEHWLIEQMGYDPVSVDDLCVLCERSSSEITTALAELELDGKVERTTFGYQRRL
ncbi:MAG: DNA-processing protein DprA [Pseudomonadales bacterium]